MNWDDLRYFLALQRSGSLAAAGRSLQVEHTTVARRLAALQEGLGGELFLRTREGYRLTPAGEKLLPVAEQMELAVAAAEKVVAQAATEVEGLVRLTTSETFSGFLVRQLVPLRARHPRLLVEVLTGNARLDLARGEADLAVRFASTEQPDLLVRKLVESAWALYVSPTAPGAASATSARDLAGREVIAFETTMSRIPGALWLEEHGAAAKVVLRANSIVAAYNAAVMGLGIAALPCFLGDAESGLRRVGTELVGSRTMTLVLHPDAAKVPRVRAVADHVLERIRSQADLLEGRAGR